MTTWYQTLWKITKAVLKKIFFIAFIIKGKEGKREGGRHGVWEEERRKEEWGEYLYEIRGKAVLKITHFGSFL